VPARRPTTSFYSLGLRQFERNFDLETGASPKAFARVARFQATLDGKVVSPERSWVDIAHSFGYTTRCG
jgi:transcriptional regulator GlxA family with amidase domain